jgi:hypothetical protein
MWVSLVLVEVVVAVNVNGTPQGFFGSSANVSDSLLKMRIAGLLIFDSDPIIILDSARVLSVGGHFRCWRTLLNRLAAFVGAQVGLGRLLRPATPATPHSFMVSQFIVDCFYASFRTPFWLPLPLPNIPGRRLPWSWSLVVDVISHVISFSIPSIDQVLPVVQIGILVAIEESVGGEGGIHPFPILGSSVVGTLGSWVEDHVSGLRLHRRSSQRSLHLHKVFRSTSEVAAGTHY